MPKAIGVASCHPYYEFLESILQDLYQRFHCNNRGQYLMSESLLEQHIYNYVFRVPTPLQNKLTVSMTMFDGNEL